MLCYLVQNVAKQGVPLCLLLHYPGHYYINAILWCYREKSTQVEICTRFVRGISHFSGYPPLKSGFILGCKIDSVDITVDIFSLKSRLKYRLRETDNQIDQHLQNQHTPKDQLLVYFKDVKVKIIQLHLLVPC